MRAVRDAGCLTHQPGESLEGPGNSDLRVDLDEHVQRRQDVNLDGHKRKGKWQGEKKKANNCRVRKNKQKREWNSGGLARAHQLHVCRNRRNGQQ